MGAGGSTYGGMSQADQADVAKKLSLKYESMKTAGQSDDSMRIALQKLTSELLEVTLKTRVSLVTGTQIPVVSKSRRDTGIIKKGGVGIPGLKRPPALDGGGFAEGEEDEDEDVKPAPMVKVAAVVSAKPAAVGRQKSHDKELPAGKGKGGATRRRSFEPSDKTSGGAPGMSESQSSPFIASPQVMAAREAEGAGAGAAEEMAAVESAPVPAQSDHWDSVTQLPYCNVCEMAFKSQGILDRHNKYSDLHLRTVKRMEEAQAAALLKSAEEPESESMKLHMEQSKQVEGLHYRHLYYGSKFFWRTKDNIDFTFFHHLLADCVEVVPFSVYKNRELKRLYLNMYLVAVRFPLDGQKGAPTPGIIIDETNRAAITTFILARLQLTGDGDNQTVQYLPAGGDDFKSPALEAKPLMVIPRPVVHRRNTSNEEVTKKLEELRADQLALAASTNHAERIGSFVVSFANNFKKSSKRLAAMTAARRRWVMTINRVLQINGVLRTTRYLEEMERLGQKPGIKTAQRARARSETDTRKGGL